ncbi:hypothetical protein HFD91_07775 [Enterobacteriaceae bacterium EKM102V]|uniref:hypothetical protein n=1 Tax=Pantoea TaxID=53335 RepID=UPI00142DC2E3|nr:MULTISPECIES: hypothetical protein [Pantoea]KAF6661279.1 hypothetical protein HFD91_07775 [Enterobacteriaceae bacterium EKM102V]KAF6668212.1 hypothetical protein HFD97_09280 [Pantoea sp. EKM103V]
MDISGIPPSIYILTGSLSIALISCLSAYVSAVYNKENKISEFRQEWANELRDESSKLISKLNHLSLVSAAFMGVNDSKIAFAEIVEDKYKHMLMIVELKSEIKELSSKIRIRLNPKKLKDKSSIESIVSIKMVEIDSLINNFAMDHEKNGKANIDVEIHNLENKLRELIKDNWEVVKSGESAYIVAKRMTFWASITMFVFIIVTTIIISISLFKSQKLNGDENSKGSQKIEVTIESKPYYLMRPY